MKNSDKVLKFLLELLFGVLLVFLFPMVHEVKSLQLICPTKIFP